MPSITELKAQVQQFTNPLNGSMGALILNMGKLYNTAESIGMSLPYIHEASSGAVQNYGARKIIETAKRAATDSDYQNALSANQNAAALSTGNNFGDVQFGRTQMGFRANGNPIYYGGTTQATFNDEVFDIPNAVAQQMKYQAAYNQGRWNPADMFGKRQLETAQANGQQYYSYDAGKQAMNRFINNTPALKQEGALSPYQKAVDAASAATNEVKQIENKLTTGYKERRNVAGQIIGADIGADLNSQLANARQQQAMATRDANNYGRARGDAIAAGLTKQGLDAVDQYFRPTTSNLKIKETLIK